MAGRIGGGGSGGMTSTGTGAHAHASGALERFTSSSSAGTFVFSGGIRRYTIELSKFVSAGLLDAARSGIGSLGDGAR